jgi:hypothetical protein
MAYFVVTEVAGAGWDDSAARRAQPGWDEHAAFMDGLVDGGFVVLGGPIGDGERVMLVMEAADEREIESRLAQDPWLATQVLRVSLVESWTVWLDGRRSNGRQGNGSDQGKGSGQGDEG